MLKRRFKFVPTWEGPIEAWAIGYALTNVWRVQPEHDVDDIMQEARILFLRCRELYWPNVQEPKHFMALFKMAFTNKIINLSNRRTRRGEVQIDYDSIEAKRRVADHALDEVDIYDLASANEPLERLIRQLVDSTMSPRPMRLGKGQPFRRKRETTNQFLARIAGVDASTDVAALILGILQGDKVAIPHSQID